MKLEKENNMSICGTDPACSRNPKASVDRNQWLGELKNLLWFIILRPQLEDFHAAHEPLGGDACCFRGRNITHVKDAVEPVIL